MKIWHNGLLVDELKLPAIGAGWLMGDGAFETIRTYSGIPFAIDLHLKRLNHSLEHLGIETVDPGQLEKGVQEVVSANPAEPYGRLRITVFSDGETLITHIPYESPNENASLARYPNVKNSQYSISNTKSASYAENFRAVRLAKARGFSDALFVNERNEVVESAVANIIVHRDGKWLTPKMDSGCLPGVTRSLLIQNFEVLEATVLEKELSECDAIALISSLREIVPVERYEGNFYPSFKPLVELRALFSNWIRAKIKP